MTYEAFLTCLESALEQEKREEEQIRRVRVLKNNGVYLDGFACRLPERREEPTVYVNEYYQEQIEPDEIQNIAQMILELQRNSRRLSMEHLEDVLNYEQIKERIFYRLVSREQNEKLLQKVPHAEWEDLALVFYLRLPEEMVQHATAIIYSSYLELWEIDEAELYQTASENMRQMEAVLQPAEVFLGEYGLECGENQMYILSNAEKEFGAAVFVREEVQKACAERLKGDYYVLPSSIHELILLPAEWAGERAELDALIREVNRDCVSREDYLGSHAYRYVKDSETLEF